MREILTLSLLTLITASLMPTGAAPLSKRPDRVAVSCDAEGTELLDQVCPILIRTLNEAGLGDAVFVADDGATRAKLYVRLETQIASRNMLKGRLKWRRSRDAANEAEPEITLRISDGELTEGAIGNFARALVKVSVLPLGE